MSKNLPYQQASNVVRRTWDREAYEAKAKARAANSADIGSGAVPAAIKRPRSDQKTATTAAITADIIDVDDDAKEEFRPAAPSAAKAYGSKRALLQAREHRVAHIDSRVGKTELVSAEQVATNKSKSSNEGDGAEVSITDGVFKTGVGWHCKVCDCYLKDSHTYLDHINGRKHQRQLGYSMRVERNTKEQILVKLQELTAAKAAQQAVDDNDDKQMTLEDLIKAKDAEAERRREERRARRRKGKDDNNVGVPQPPPIPKEEQQEVEERKEEAVEEKEEDEERQEEEMDPAMAAMMGFAGFGGSKKNR